LSEELIEQPPQAAAEPEVPAKKTRKPREKKPPKPKKVKPARDLRSVFRQKLKDIKEDDIKSHGWPPNPSGL